MAKDSERDTKMQVAIELGNFVDTSCTLYLLFLYLT